MKLSEIKATLLSMEIEPTRSLGQNFLHDQNLAGWIVDQLDLGPDEPWVEIGPGLGSLTEVLARRSPRGMLIEKDDRIVDHLRSRFGVPLIHGDAAAFDVRELAHQGPTKIIGNLPYYISSQILFNFIQEHAPVTRMVFTLQRELAERLCASPRTKDYGALTLQIGRLWKVRIAKILPATIFYPVPQVESAVVVLTRKAAGEIPDCDGMLFTQLVKQGFSQRRKQMHKLLKPGSLSWKDLCAALGVPETVRAEELGLDQWVRLTNLHAGAGLDSARDAQDVHGEMFDVVDENDEVIGTQSRHVVHEKDLRHRAVHIFVLNRRGEIFLQKRSRWKDRHPLQWDSSAAGHVNAGDTYDVTAPREVEEELGVQTECTAIGQLPANVQTGWEFVRLYRAEHGGPFRLPPAEIECGAWFTIAQVQRWTEARPEDFAPGFLECWRHFQTLPKPPAQA